MHFIPMQYPVYLYFILYSHVNSRHLSPLLICHSYHCCIYQYNYHYYYYHYLCSFYIPYSTVSLFNFHLLPIFGFILPPFCFNYIGYLLFHLGSLCGGVDMHGQHAPHVVLEPRGRQNPETTSRSPGDPWTSLRVGGGGSDTADHHPTPLFRRVVVVVPRVGGSPPPR